jgi:hypothetical protein
VLGVGRAVLAPDFCRKKATARGPALRRAEGATPRPTPTRMASSCISLLMIHAAGGALARRSRSSSRTTPWRSRKHRPLVGSSEAGRDPARRCRAGPPREEPTEISPARYLPLRPIQFDVVFHLVLSQNDTVETRQFSGKRTMPNMQANAVYEVPCFRGNSRSLSTASTLSSAFAIHLPYVCANCQTCGASPRILLVGHEVTITRNRSSSHLVP